MLISTWPNRKAPRLLLKPIEARWLRPASSSESTLVCRLPRDFWHARRFESATSHPARRWNSSQTPFPDWMPSPRQRQRITSPPCKDWAARSSGTATCWRLLASFSRALQIAERQSSPGGSMVDLAAANFWVGAVLARNGENEAAAAKLRKAFELYRDIAGAHVNSAEDSPAGYRKALEDLAGQASPELRQTIEAQLRESTPVLSSPEDSRQPQPRFGRRKPGIRNLAYGPT